MTKKERKEYDKKYNETHKEKRKEQNNKYYETHKEKMNDQNKKYYETHKEEINKRYKNYYNKTKNYLINIYQVYRYFTRNFSRYISLENYIAIMKTNDLSLKRSIMIRLGKGLIDEDEAVALSGIILSDEEKEELKNIFNNLDIKRK
jgi:hypothetical protein